MRNLTKWLVPFIAVTGGALADMDNGGVVTISAVPTNTSTAAAATNSTPLYGKLYAVQHVKGGATNSASVSAWITTENAGSFGNVLVWSNGNVTVSPGADYPGVARTDTEGGSGGSGTNLVCRALFAEKLVLYSVANDAAHLGTGSTVSVRILLDKP